MINGTIKQHDFMNLSLADILSEAQIIIDLPATDRWEAIDELITNLVQTGKVKAEDRDAIVGAVRKRERSMSTGIGYGLGIPHASTELVHEPVAALGRSKSKISFDSLDGKPVSLVVLFLVPQGQFQKHLHTVAEIAKFLQNSETRQALELAPDASTIYRIIRGTRGNHELV
jgi:mannitol/fructose-specific phosphotransferase system IIA component (Ntr-type)